MTTLIWQTALMLLCAYFLGAWVACLVRRTFFASYDAPALAAPELPRKTATSIGNLQVAGQSIAPPVRRPDPKPIALETIERAAPKAAADAANRFENILTTAPKQVATAAEAIPLPAATPAAPPVNRTAPATPAVNMPAAAANVVAGTLAAAATPVAAQLAKPAATIAAPLVQPAVQAPVMPAAASGSTPAIVPAPVAAPAADDLTLIRAIDPALRAQLQKIGVSRFRDMAAWMPADVAKISQALGFSGRIEQENWIEQAQILARGGETAYARRKLRGEADTAPAASAGLHPKPVTAPATVAPVAPAAATMPQVESRAAFAQPSTSAPKPAVAGPAPTPIQTVAPKPAASVSVPSTPAVSAGGAMAAAASATATAAAAAAGHGSMLGTARDNLQRISGINAEVEKLLNVQGVSRYSQIASWSSADAMRIDRLFGQEGRVARESWVEQATMLSRGGDTAFSRQFDQRTAPRPARVLEDAPRPNRLADAIRDTTVKTVAEPVATPRTSDMSALRSVRSEAYAPLGGSTAAGMDDLKRIRGVGVLIEKKLNSMGIMSYAQVANWSAADIDRVSQLLDFRGRIERENWIEQARILSAGGQTEFSRRVDRGEVETSKNR